MTTPQQEVSTIRPADLRNWEGVLYVRNDSNMTISFDDDKGTVISVPAKGKDDSIQVLPLEMARNPGFQKLWRRGEVSVSTDPAIEEELTLMEQRAAIRRDAQFEALSEVMDAPPEDRDLIPDQCLHCNKMIFRPAGEVRANTAPALCEDHKDLSYLFSAVEYSEDGKTKTKWVPVQTKKKVVEQQSAVSVATAEEK